MNGWGIFGDRPGGLPLFNSAGESVVLAGKGFRRQVADGDDRVGRATHPMEESGWRGRRSRHARARVLPGTGDSAGGTPTGATGTVALPEKSLIIGSFPRRWRSET